MTESPGRRLRIAHVSRFDYDEPAHGSLMLLRLMPREDGGQRTLDFRVEIDPPAAPTPFADSFGNRCHLLNIHRRHRHMSVRSELRVETAPAADVRMRSRRRSWDALVSIADPTLHWEMLNPTRLTRPGPALEAFMATNDVGRGDDPLSALLDVASTLHRVSCYEPGSTDIDTSIERFLETGRGVCQDYAHAIIAVGRRWGVPSRYVSGYLHLEGREDERTPAGASHAWAEFLLPDLGWVGIDPTNDTIADRRHVRIAVGRDYVDAAPTRGTVFGGGGSRLEVRVTVEDDEAPAAAPVPARRFTRTGPPGAVPAAAPGGDQ